MRITSRLVAVTAATALSAVVLAACGSDSDKASSVAADCKPVADVKTVKDGVLTVSHAEFPPYITTKDGQPAGIDGELIKKIAADLCLELDAKNTSFPAVISSLDSGKADLSLGSWTLNEERRQKFEVSEGVYLSLPGVVSKDGISTVDGLMGKKVGTTTGYLWVGDLQKAIGAGNVKLYQSEQSVYDDLKAGRIDAGVFTEGAVAGYMSADGNQAGLKLAVLEEDERVEATVNTEPTVALIRKGSTDLKAAVDSIIKDFQSSGELEKLLVDAGIDKVSAIK
jgi:polar amino acid transport system substrate-binding protein